jgi:hypothetical protein
MEEQCVSATLQVGNGEDMGMLFHIERKMYSLNASFTHPMLNRRFSCQEIPNGSVGYDHQYHGFNVGTLGNVTTLFGPHGTFHFNFK